MQQCLLFKKKYDTTSNMFLVPILFSTAGWLKEEEWCRSPSLSAGGLITEESEGEVARRRILPPLLCLFGFAHAKPTVAHYDMNFLTFVDLVSNMSSALINAQPLDGFNCRWFKIEIKVSLWWSPYKWNHWRLKSPIANLISKLGLRPSWSVLNLNLTSSLIVSFWKSNLFLIS